MIQLPERAVTRFFVPLIDVLILLFCIFLLLPFVSAQADQPTPDPAAPADPETLRAELKKVKEELAKEQKHAADLMKERADSAQRTVVWVIDIDGASGKLTYTPPDGPPGKVVELKTAAQARELILNAEKATDERAVKYLFLLPREGGAYPDEPMYKRLEEWFKDESVAFVRR